MKHRKMPIHLYDEFPTLNLEQENKKNWILSQFSSFEDGGFLQGTPLINLYYKVKTGEMETPFSCISTVMPEAEAAALELLKKGVDELIVDKLLPGWDLRKYWTYRAQQRGVPFFPPSSSAAPNLQPPAPGSPMDLSLRLGSGGSERPNFSAPAAPSSPVDLSLTLGSGGSSAPGGLSPTDQIESLSQLPFLEVVDWGLSFPASFFFPFLSRGLLLFLFFIITRGKLV